jgi:hypothetical protein
MFSTGIWVYFNYWKMSELADGFCFDFVQARAHLAKFGDLNQTQILAKIENIEA